MRVFFWGIDMAITLQEFKDAIMLSLKKTWFKNLGKILEKITNSKVKFVTTPKYTKKVDVGNFIVDNSKLRKLGWIPKISIESGIRKTLDYFHSQKL